MINRAPSRPSSDSIFCGLIDHPPRQQLVDLGLYLRRRRYGASHGVGLLHRLSGLEGTYAVATTAPEAYLQQLLGATATPPEPRIARNPRLSLAIAFVLRPAPRFATASATLSGFGRWAAGPLL